MPSTSKRVCAAHLPQTTEFFTAAAHAHLTPFALLVLGDVEEHPIAISGAATAQCVQFTGHQ